MNERPWYKRYPSDFLHGTAGMSLEVKGAYSVVLDLIYDRRGPIPDDARWIAGHCGCSVRHWNRIRGVLIEAGKLASDGAFLTNPRAEREVAAVAETARKLAENGAKGGNKSAETRRNFAIIRGGFSENNDLAEAPASAGLKHARAFQRLDTRNPPKSPVGDERDFLAFKEAYPARDGNQGWAKAKERFARIVAKHAPPADLIGAAQAYRTEMVRKGNVGTAFVKQAATFLSGTWQDYLPSGQQEPKPASPPENWPTNLPAPDRVRAAWKTGRWADVWGPPPDQSGCRVPAAILQTWGAA